MQATQLSERFLCDLPHDLLKLRLEWPKCASEVGELLSAFVLAKTLWRVCSGLRDRKESVAVCAASLLQLGWIQDRFKFLGLLSLLSALSWG